MVQIEIKQILEEDDISGLNRGDVLDFFPDGLNHTHGRAVFLGTNDYSVFFFVGRDDDNPEKIYEFGIRRDRLIPTEIGLLDVVYRSTYRFHEITPENNPMLYELRDGELRSKNL